VVFKSPHPHKKPDSILSGFFIFFILKFFLKKFKKVLYKFKIMLYTVKVLKRVQLAKARCGSAGIGRQA